MPFHGEDNPYTASARYIDVLTDVMNDRVAFHRMTPHDHLLTEHDPYRVWCLAERGKQYLVFAVAGEPFTLHVAAGEYGESLWIDAKTGEARPAEAVSASSGELAKAAPDDRRIGTKAVRLTPPNRETDWVLVLRGGQ
jgi:hypothetical protein